MMSCVLKGLSIGAALVLAIALIVVISILAAKRFWPWATEIQFAVEAKDPNPSEKDYYEFDSTEKDD